MFTTATKKNMVVTTALCVSYEVAKQTTGSTTWYKVTRKATKEYQFIDLAASAVDKVFYAKQLKYSRRTCKAISATADAYVEECQSKITKVKNDSGSYNVEIEVSETDSKHSATIPATPSSLFTDENARDYDETAASCTVDSCVYTTDHQLVIYVNTAGSATQVTMDEIKFKYGGQQVTSNVTIYMIKQNQFLVKVTNWTRTHCIGTIELEGYDCSCNWEYSPGSIELANNTYAEAWEPPTSMVHYDLTATLQGGIQGETASVCFWCADQSAPTDFVDITSMMTLTVDTTNHTVRGTYDCQIPALSGTLYFKASVDDVESSVSTFTWSV